MDAAFDEMLALRKARNIKVAILGSSGCYRAFLKPPGTLGNALVALPG
jgi:hypothetical protein